MTPLHFQSATQLATTIRARDISAADLLEHFVERIDRFNPALNAIVDTNLEQARTEARAADEAVARGDVLGALHGVPMTLKDSIQRKGMKATWGSPLFKDYQPEVNTDFVDNLIAAGAVIFGKTNLPEFGDDTLTFNDVYGQTNNPWDLERSPGGSSGGSAVALATGMTGIEMGSDIGGSIRSPAHYTGVYGHKPSFGIVPTQGTFPPSPTSIHSYSVPFDLVVSGPMARSAEDLEMMMDLVVAPPRPSQIAYSINLPKPRKESLKDYRIGIWIDDANFGPDSEVGDRLQNTVDCLAAAGAQIVDKRPDIDIVEAFEDYYQLLTMATVHAKPDAEFDTLLQLAAAEPTSENDDVHNYAMAITQTHRNWSRLNDKRATMRRKWASYFEDVDVMFCPASRVTAMHHDNQPFGTRRNVVNGQELTHWETVMPWAGFSLMSCLPATCAPVGQSASGLPVGMQIVGPWLEDKTPIHVAQLMQDVVGGFTPPPGYE